MLVGLLVAFSPGATAEEFVRGEVWLMEPPTFDGTLNSASSGALEVQLRGAHVTFAKKSRSVAYMKSETLHLQGALRGRGASGWVGQDGWRRQLHDADLALAGNVSLQLTPAPPPNLLDVLAPSRGDRLVFEGGADSVTLDGRAAFAWVPAAAPSLEVAMAGGGAAALLSFLNHLRNGWCSYSRTPGEGILENSNRRRIYQHVRQSKGCSVAELARACAISPRLAGYHVRMLLLGRYVAVVREGRTRLVFPVSVRQQQSATRALRTLRGAKRIALTEALRTEPEGLTQAELSRRTGLSRRLVSYHLGRLVGAGLAEPQQGHRPLRYALRTGEPHAEPRG